MSELYRSRPVCSFSAARNGTSSHVSCSGRIRDFAPVLMISMVESRESICAYADFIASPVQHLMPGSRQARAQDSS